MESLKPIEYRLLPKNEDKPPLFKKSRKGTLKGYAIIWDTPYYFGSFIEQVSRDAIKNCDLSDIVCCLNHSADAVLGRTTSNTLKVGSDSRGLWYECLIPDTPTGAEVQELVERGDLHQCSFSFRLAKNGDTWDQPPGSVPIRTLTAFHSIVDVSVVTWPASPTTSVYVARTAPDEVDPDNEIDRIHAAQAQMMERGNTQLKALTAGSTTTTTWTPSEGISDEEYRRMEKIMLFDAEYQLEKMRSQRATDAHIDLTLARMKAVIDADTVRMAKLNEKFTTKRF
jgi:HK97 family phage prohead protease